MRIKIWLSVLSLFLVVLVWELPVALLLAEPVNLPSASPGVTRALLIGINNYTVLPPLYGSLNDIETMRQILITRWGFLPEHITLVANEAATREGMLAAMERLIQETGPNDTVYFHYSGHGSQVKDLNGDEPDDGLDETLVPQDGRSGTVRDITDDELNALFARLQAKRALIVLDSCHSGTATRSRAFRTRSVPADTRVDLYQQAEEAAPKTRAIVPVLTSRYVLMTGAASHQEALDGPVDGQPHGFFTYALSKSLSTAPSGSTPLDVFRGVERELTRIQHQYGRTSMPEPQLEAAPQLLDQPLLTLADLPDSPQEEGTSARRPWLAVEVGTGSELTLVNGPLLGAWPGSTWLIYPPEETQFLPGLALAVATVTRLRGRDALAVLEPTAATIPAGGRAIALLPASTSERIPIRILDVPPTHPSGITEILEKYIKNVEFVDEHHPAQFLIDIHADSIRLLSADGLQVVESFALDNDRWGAELGRIISRSVHVSELLTLENPLSQITIEARMANAVPTQPTVSTRGVTLVANTQPSTYHVLQANEPRSPLNSLQLEVRVNVDAYLTIVNVDSEGGLNLFFPNVYQKQEFYPDGFLRLGQTALIPDSLQSENRAGFYWDYGPPKGTDTLRIFASTDLPTANLIRQQIRHLQSSDTSTRGTVTTRSVMSGLNTLRQGLTQVTSRGIVTVAGSFPQKPSQLPSTPDKNAGLLLSGTPPGNISQDPLISDIPNFSHVQKKLTVSTSLPAMILGSDWTATSLTVLIAD